jgi:alkanesulfonate monooxygenase SsuD/methylene tetrahydromethanopterin reductase-like flavin-dependent oxidoreductase (luciferase family)
MLLGQRQPAWAAKQLATIDALSGGRLRLGAGVSVDCEFPDEFGAPGLSARQQAARLDDALHVIGDLLTGHPVDYHGRVLSVRAPGLQPAMAAPPPIYVGGRGEAALQRVATHGDVWLPMWLSPRRIAERSRRLAELAWHAGRPAPGTAVLIGVNIDDNRSRARAEAEAHMRGQYRMELEAVERWTLLDSIDGAVAHLEAFTQVGVDEFVLMPLGREPLTQYERLAEVSLRLQAGLERRTAAAEVRG